MVSKVSYRKVKGYAFVLLRFLSMLLTLKAETNLDTGEPLEELTPPVQQVMKDIGLECVQTTKAAVEELQKNPQGALASLIQSAITK